MNREQWLEERRKGIGGSDIHNLFDLEPYGCRKHLWMDKRGLPQDYPMLNQKALKRGTKMEPLIVEEYIEETGNIVEPGAELVAHPENSFMLANTDGNIKDEYFDERGYGVLECKVPGKEMFFKMLQGGLPESHILQMQSYLYTLDLQWGAYAVFWADNWQLITFEVLRDDKLIDTIVKAADSFWRTVQNGPAPERLDMTDDRCKVCVYRKSCWEDKYQEIAEDQKKNPEGIDFNDDTRFIMALDDYRSGKKLEQEGIAQKEAAQKTIQGLMGNNGLAYGGGAKIHYKLQEAKRWDTKALSEDRPELEAKYKRPSTSRPFRVYGL